ncbi:hypothetical protein EC890511_3465, partial [Escherichia coli 89.0511]
SARARLKTKRHAPAKRLISRSC